MNARVLASADKVVMRKKIAIKVLLDHFPRQRLIDRSERLGKASQVRCIWKVESFHFHLYLNHLPHLTSCIQSRKALLVLSGGGESCKNSEAIGRKILEARWVDGIR
jgi:hypothetical protein